MPRKKKIFGVASCIIGNTLEWFDYGLYSALAATIADLFFPSGDPVSSQLKAFGVFAVGFITRPFGGILFGYIGDKLGRKSALLLSIFLMAIPTALIGMLPTYAQIGILAPIILTIVRMVQGLAIGGEFTGSMVYLTEQSGSKNRGFMGSWSDFGSPLGFLLGTLVATTLSFSLSKEDFLSWGWRVPFIMSVFIALFGLYLRRHLDETELFKKETKEQRKVIPYKEIFKNYKMTTLLAALITTFSGVCFYIPLTSLPNYLVKAGALTQSNALLLNTFANLAMTIAIPIAGYFSDRLGRKFVLRIGIVSAIFLAYPLLYTVGNLGLNIVFQVLFGIAVGVYFGGRAAFYSESFPTEIRCSAVSIAFGVSHAIFAGSTPAVATFLASWYGDIKIVSVMVFAVSSFALFALYKLPDRTGQPLQ